MAYSLLYVSKTLLEFPAGEAEVANIVATAVSRNATLGVTGALISTGTHFAQVLEGERAAVDELMASIGADPRHMRVKTIRTTEEERRFGGWSMAYAGNAGFVDRHITPLFSPLPPGDTAHLALRLIALMDEFARLPPG
jgi:Sensors of blue-light using FAD